MGALMAIFGATTLAQSVPTVPCAAYADVVAEISGEAYGELRLGAGGSGSGGTLEIWVNAETGTWSALTVTPDGAAACLAASGNDWVFGGGPEAPASPSSKEPSL